MYWYDGSIAEAVTLSKQKNAIFVVFVEGENDLSTEMAATIDDTAVVSRLSNQTNFLAVKLKSGSTNYMHFAQIYQFVPVPSLFFIGRNGTPLEVVCAGVQSSDLATRIDRILEEHRKEKLSPIEPSTSSQSIKEQTSNLLQSEAQASTTENIKREKPAESEPEPSSASAAKIQKTDDEYEVVCDGDVCVRRPKSKDQAGPSHIPSVEKKEKEMTNESPSTAESSGNIEEKLEKAKELIEARRREKAEKEKELERQKELERRAQGQGIVELKRWQADQELKQIQEERKREKMENNLARQRILEQIAQDRAERRARDTPAPTQPQQTPTVPATSGDGGTRARIQLKLPDGSSHIAHFEAEDTIGDVHRYVCDNLQMTRSSFSLWIAFPRRELTEPSDTLRQLQLAPSAALLVLPTRQAAVPPRPTPFASLITFFTHLFTSLILEPSQQLYTWIRSRLFPPPTTRRSPSPSPAPRNIPPVRRRGNIHRLGGDAATDDDNNTWNGNSTQQM